MRIASGATARLLGCMLIGLTQGVSLAQINQGPTAPGQIEREFQRPPVAAQPQPPVAPVIEQQAPPPGADKVRFTLRELSVEGATVYKPSELKPYYARYVGKEISLADVYAIAAALTNKYRNDGYVLSQVVVPAQKIDNGTVQLRAIEGYIAKVEVDGKVLGPRSTIDKLVDNVKQVRPVTAAAIERNLLIANDLPGVSAQGVLLPSSEPGAADTRLVVNQKRVDGSIDVNNRGSRSLGPWRAEANVGVNSLLWGFDRFSLGGAQTLGNDSLTYVTAGYDRFISTNGLAVSLNGSYVDSHPNPDVTQNANLPTNSYSGTLGVQYPFLRSRISNLSGRASFSYYDGHTDQVLNGVSEPLHEDNVRPLRLGLTYDTIDRWRGINLVDVEVSQGLDIWGATAPGNDPTPTNPSGEPNFTKITLYASRLQSLFPKVSALFALQGQYGFGGIPAPEQYAVGGEFFGKAYDSGELVGDSGIALKVELRYTGTTSRFVRSYTVFGFWDFGATWLAAPDPNGQNDQSIASAGGGIRFTLSHSITGYLYVAVPLTAIVVQEGNKDPRVFGGIGASF